MSKDEPSPKTDAIRALRDARAAQAAEAQVTANKSKPKPAKRRAKRSS